MIPALGHDWTIVPAWLFIKDNSLFCIFPFRFLAFQTFQNEVSCGNNSTLCGTRDPLQWPRNQTIYGKKSAAIFCTECKETERKFLQANRLEDWNCMYFFPAASRWKTIPSKLVFSYISIWRTYSRVGISYCSRFSCLSEKQDVSPTVSDTLCILCSKRTFGLAGLLWDPPDFSSLSSPLHPPFWRALFFLGRDSQWKMPL